MTKKLIAVIVGSIIAGMMGAYVAEASSTNPLESFVTILGVAKAEASNGGTCGAGQVTNCCIPQPGVFKCEANGWPRIIDSCGNHVNTCPGGYSCNSGSCVLNPACDPNGALVGCQDANTATNGCGKTQACGSGYECKIWEGCVPKDNQELWWCSDKSDVDQQFYSRYSNNGASQICTGGCNPDGNSDGHTNDAVCKPGGCPLSSKQYWHCSVGGQIVNGCGEVVDDCAAQGLTCSGEKSSCKCVGTSETDMCPNIPGKQNSIPDGMIKDANGNCVSTPTYPVWKCTASGRRQQSAKRNWVSFDSSKTYQLDEEVSLNEGQNPPSSSCVKPITPTNMRVTKTSDIPVGTRIKSGDLVTYTITFYNDGPGVLVRSRLTDRIPKGMRFVSSSRDYNIIDTNGFVALETSSNGGYAREVLPDGKWYYRGKYNGGGPTNIECLTLSSTVGVLQKGSYICRHTNNTDWWLGGSSNPSKSRGTDSIRVWGKEINGEWKYDSSSRKRAQVISGDLLQWYWGDVQPNTSEVVTLTLQYDGSLDGQCIDNVARGGMDNPAATPINTVNDQATATVCVGPLPQTDVTITKSVDKSTFPNKTGELITWTLTYENRGPQTAENVIIRDILPHGLSFTGSRVASGKISSITVSTTGVVTYALKDPLPSGASGTIVLQSYYVGGKANGTTLRNSVRISTSTDETDLTNNSDGDTTTPQGERALDLKIEKTTLTPTFPNKTGEQITWTIEYANIGLTTGTDVIVTDRIPEYLSFVSSIPTPTLTGTVGWMMPGVKYNQTNTPTPITNGVQWNIGTLAPGQTGSITLVTSYKGGAADGTKLTNTVLIKADQDENTYTNNESEDDTSPEGQPHPSCDLLTWSLAQPTTTGARIDYHCTATNATTVQFRLLSGSTVIASGSTPEGTVYAPFGMYTGQCVVDGTITHKVTIYRPTTVVACAYRKHKTNNTTCAVKSNLQPASIGSLDLTNLQVMANPVPYCTATQESDNVNYACESAPAGSQILIQDPNSCTATGVKVPVWAKLGDLVWHDADKDGIQDANESGISGSKVSLYTCGGALSSTIFTSSTGWYMFDGLYSGSYKVVFDLPTGYSTFTYKNAAGSNTGNDSNVGATNGTTECIQLNEGDTNMTIDAGVYNTGGNPPGGNSCGNGKLEEANGEKCDDGNATNGDGCSSTCQIETGCSRGRCGGNNGGAIKTGSIIKNATGGFIDPPDVMIGEYMPFWWGFDKASNVTFVPSCNLEYNPNVTYVLNEYSNDKAAQCDFIIRNGKGEKSDVISAHCDQRRPLLEYPLFRSYFSNVGDSVVRNYSGADGASFVVPSNWKKQNGGEIFTTLGEYNLVWQKTTFHTCEPEFETVSTWKEDADGTRTETKETKFKRYNISSLYESDVEIFMPFTVSKPYMTQQNGLSASATDADIMNKITKIDGVAVLSGLKATTTTTMSYSGSSNLNYLVTSFVQKYDKLATVNTKIGGNTARKVANAEIYILSSGSSISALGTSLKQKTIIVPRGDITIRGDVSDNVMVIVPNGTIKFELNGDHQSVNGIYISQSVSSINYHNSDIDKSPWRFGGGLTVNGLIVTKEANAVANLKQSRRSVLKGWFSNGGLTDTSSINALRAKIVQDGAALQVRTSSDLWLNLPAGANELMQGLQTYR